MKNTGKCSLRTTPTLFVPLTLCRSRERFQATIHRNTKKNRPSILVIYTSEHQTAYRSRFTAPQQNTTRLLPENEHTDFVQKRGEKATVVGINMYHTTDSYLETTKNCILLPPAFDSTDNHQRSTQTRQQIKCFQTPTPWRFAADKTQRHQVSSIPTYHSYRTAAALPSP